MFVLPSRHLAVFAVLALANAALADTGEILQANRQIRAQFISIDVDYTEYGDGVLKPTTGPLDSESGRVPGVAFELSYMGDPATRPVYVAASYATANGSTHYTGQPANQWNSYGSITGQSSARITDLSMRLGRPWRLIGQSLLTPYAEFGHHTWERGVNQGETYDHDYWGAGVLLQHNPAPHWVVSGNLMAGRTQNARINANGVFNQSLDNSSIVTLGAGADYAFSQKLHGNIGIDQTRFNYGKSSIQNNTYEPDSKTTYTTVRVGIGYAF